MDVKEKKAALFLLFIVVFIDLLGFGIAIPVLAPAFLDPTSGVFAPGTALAVKEQTLGILLGIYALATFFGAPLLGGLSDHYGRKKMLVLSTIGEVVGYVLFAFGLMTQNLVLLFIARIIAGLMGGNIAIAYSAIADLSEPKDKAKNFGLIGMAFGLGFVFGPFIGGVLSDAAISPLFNYATPFWLAAAIAFINIFCIQFVFKETLRTKSHTKINLLSGIKNLGKAIQMQNLRWLFAVSFLITFGFSMHVQFFQVFMIEKFQFSVSQIGFLFGFLGICVAIAQGFIVRPLNKKFSPKKLLPLSLAGMAIVLFFFTVPTDSFWIYMLIPLLALSNGVTLPNISTLVSNSAAPESQGEIFGINQSINALAQALPPFIAGFIIAFNVNLPVLVGASVIAIAWAVFVFVYLPSKQKVFHEV